MRLHAASVAVLLACALATCTAASAVHSWTAAEFVQHKHAPNAFRSQLTLGGVHSLHPQSPRAVAEGVDMLSFEMRQFDVFANDATVVVHGANGAVRERPAPRNGNTFYVGHVVGEEGASSVFVKLTASGGVSGRVQRGDAFSLLQHAVSDGILHLLPEVDAPVAPAFPSSLLHDAHGCEAHPSEHRNADQERSARSVDAWWQNAYTLSYEDEYTARLAYESDYEFFALFGNEDDATDFIEEMTALTSAVFLRDVNMNLIIASVSLWETADDPWVTDDKREMLDQFGGYWYRFHKGTTRDVAQFLSGRALGGGQAWLEGVCDADVCIGGDCSSSSTDTTNLPSVMGAYSICADIVNLDLTTRVPWPVFCLAHEEGHAMGSEHTHCYQEAVDECFSGEQYCYEGEASLPTNGGGSVMSYCHNLAGSSENLNLYLGREGYYGVESERVNDRIRTNILSESCLLKESCGNGFCAASEDCATCSADCGACPDTCGDGVCTAGDGETCSSCSADCGTCCGDGTCNYGETCDSCQPDCGECAEEDECVCTNNCSGHGTCYVDGCYCDCSRGYSGADCSTGPSRLFGRRRGSSSATTTADVVAFEDYTYHEFIVYLAGTDVTVEITDVTSGAVEIYASMSEVPTREDYMIADENNDRKITIENAPFNTHWYVSVYGASNTDSNYEILVSYEPTSDDVVEPDTGFTTTTGTDAASRTAVHSLALAALLTLLFTVLY